MILIINFVEFEASSVLFRLLLKLNAHFSSFWLSPSFFSSTLASITLHLFIKFRLILFNYIWRIFKIFSRFPTLNISYAYATFPTYQKHQLVIRNIKKLSIGWILIQNMVWVVLVFESVCYNAFNFMLNSNFLLTLVYNLCLGVIIPLFFIFSSHDNLQLEHLLKNTTFIF